MQIPENISSDVAVTGSNWHWAFDVSLGTFALLAFLFAIIVLLVVTHVTAGQTAQLKATIKQQKKEIRKAKARQAAGQELLNKNQAQKGYGTIEEAKAKERKDKIKPYRHVVGDCVVVVQGSS